MSILLHASKRMNYTSKHISQPWCHLSTRRFLESTHRTECTKSNTARRETLKQGTREFTVTTAKDGGRLVHLGPHAHSLNIILRYIDVSPVA
jgi:hypothetical protein